MGNAGAVGIGGRMSLFDSDGLVIVLDRDRVAPAPKATGSPAGIGARSRDPARNMLGKDMFSPVGRGEALGRSNWGL